MTTEIDKMRGEQKSRKSILNKEKVAVEKDKKEKVAKKAKKINTEDAGKTTEQRFRDLIREVQQKVSQIKLEKDDYKTYSEVQSNVDTFLDEATTDIMAIKNGLKRRFENIQAGKGDVKRRNGSGNNRNNKPRKPRNGKNADGKGDNQNSVFSSANPIQN